MQTDLNEKASDVLTVSELTQSIKYCLESAFPSVRLQGEISNCKHHTSGHLYFSLKDSQAQIAAVMYRGDAASLKTIPKDGSQVIVCGDLNVYPPRGNYQLIVKELKPYGVGELLLKLEELKIKLHQKGYFKKDRKRPLPKMPRRIGVVTSPTGAAIQDILHILTRRFSGFHLILNPVKVQGEGAAQEIAQAIRQFNEHDLVDVIIVGRGGGSIEDLWAFNEEIVADALYNSRIPTIAAVGHETDHCIAEYVADVRAPTPSAAAEIVIAEKAQQLQHLGQLRQRLHQTMRHLVRHQKQKLEGLQRHPLFTSPYGILGPWMQKLDDLRGDIDAAAIQRLEKMKVMIETGKKRLQSLKPTTLIGQMRIRLAGLDKAIQKSCQAGIQMRLRHLQAVQRRKQIDLWMQKTIEQRKETLQRLTAALGSVDPKNVLKKGYCILFAEKGQSVITSIESVSKGEDVQLLLTDGSLISTVKEIIPK